MNENFNNFMRTRGVEGISASMRKGRENATKIRVLTKEDIDELLDSSFPEDATLGDAIKHLDKKRDPLKDTSPTKVVVQRPVESHDYEKWLNDPIREGQSVDTNIDPRCE